MIKKYKTNYARTTIEEVECLRETDKMVVFPSYSRLSSRSERKEKKMSDWNCYFDSWDEAYSYIVLCHENKVADAKRTYEKARSVLESVKTMKQGEQ